MADYDGGELVNKDLREADARRIAAILNDDAALAASLRAGLAETVRRHRRHNVPLVVWEDEQVKEISPFSVPLPEDPNSVP